MPHTAQPPVVSAKRVSRPGEGGGPRECDQLSDWLMVGSQGGVRCSHDQSSGPNMSGDHVLSVIK